MQPAYDIAERLEAWTAVNSNFEERRDYISLSHCSLTPQELVAQYVEGFKADRKGRLRCYKGYQMEADLKERLKSAFGDRVTFGVEIFAFGGKVKGHPDFLLDTFPGDCKSVLLDEWLPGPKLPRKVFYQMQGYMFYAGADRALIVYESRESGFIRAFWIPKNAAVQEQTLAAAVELIG